MFAGKKAVIFDMDGTLIDSVGIWNEVDRVLIKRIANVEAGSAEAQQKRDAALRAFSKTENPYMEYCKQLKEEYASPFSAQQIHALRYQIADDYLANIVDYKPDAERFIKALKQRGFLLAIASVTRQANMEIYKTRNKNIKAKADLAEYFSPIYTREDALEIKPNPEVYIRVLKTLKLRAEDCLVVEDSLVGAEAANNAGIEVAVMYDRYSDREREQICALADYTFASYADALAALNRE